MSLPNKATKVRFAIKDGATGISSHVLTVSRLRVPFKLVQWEERKGLSITGKKRKANINRGVDAEVILEWDDVRNQETDITDFIDDLKVASDNDYSIRFSVDGDSNFLYVIPTDVSYNQDYTNQVTRRTPVSMTFELDTLRDDVTYDAP